MMSKLIFVLYLLSLLCHALHALPTEESVQLLDPRKDQALAQEIHLRAAGLPSGIPSPFGTIPVCVPPEALGLAGIYPESAVTTNQTGTDCTKYGDPPARVVGPIESPTGLEEAIQICHGEFVHFTDSLGERRTACFYQNRKSTNEKPLPLLVWLHPSAVSASLSFPLTGLDAVRQTQALNNEDPSRLGFSYILPFGRNTAHHYPVPDQVALGWDNWYRNTDRSSASRNADVDFIDQAIAYAKQHAIVDKRRVFLSGWSNGASMALFYSMNTDAIAAAAVYSAPDPYRDSQDPCAQTPYPKFATPIRDIHNKCDIIGTCTTGKYFFDDLRARYPHYQNSIVILDVLTSGISSTDTGAKCDPACQGACAVTTGSAAHGRWPILRNSDTIFDFMRAHPLPQSGSWGTPN